MPAIVNSDENCYILGMLRHIVTNLHVIQHHALKTYEICKYANSFYEFCPMAINVTSFYYLGSTESNGITFVCSPFWFISVKSQQEIKIYPH